MKRIYSSMLFVTLGFVLMASTLPASAQTNITPNEARAIAKEAYIYGYPMVDSYRIYYSYFVDSNDPEFKAPWNNLRNTPRVYTPDDKTIQTPNSDTPYSALGFDLRAEPIVLTVPVVDKNRYFSVQLIDAYTFNFAYIGSRATGNDGGSFLLAGPGWKGERPKGIKKMFRSETNMGWAQYRTQLINSADLENVKNVQAGYKVQTLSQFLGQPAPMASPKIDFIKPLTPDQQRNSLDFFKVLNFSLTYSDTHPSEKALMERFAKLGIGSGKAFEAEKLSPELRKTIGAGMADAWKDFAGLVERINAGAVTSGDVLGTRELLNNNYLFRMGAAVLGIFGNSKKEAMYPTYFVDAAGQKPDASKNNYTLRFAPGELPPVNAFWSLTMYKAPESLLVENPLKRYLLNSPMLPDYKRDADGGLTLYMQHDSPGKDLEPNWLPAPNGPFIMYLRLYWPKAEALDGTWKQPMLQRQEGIKVNVENYVRAESDYQIRTYAKTLNCFGKLVHQRDFYSVDNQLTVRVNRDTYYSFGLYDLTSPVTITKPDPGARFQSLMIIDQDHSISPTIHEGGTFTYTREILGSRYMIVIFRTFANATDPKDQKIAHDLQNRIKIEQKDMGKLELPNWDNESREKMMNAINVLAGSLPTTEGFFGEKDKIDPIKHLMGTAYGYAGNPREAAIYLNIVPEKNNGKTPYKVTVKDVPVDGFWSITMYNAEGYMEKNEYDSYSFNDKSAQKNKDGSITIHFGGDPKQINYLPTPKGWNTIIRLYQPRKELLEGRWDFPEFELVK